MTSRPADSPALVRPYSLAPARYLELLRADAGRLVQVAARVPTAAVDGCPGWSVRDLVDHVAMVYLHKVECLRQGAAPDPWPPVGQGTGGIPAEPFSAIAACLAALLAELSARHPGDTTFTWFPPDQTVGFWYRRMAHETAIHRLDAERAAGSPTSIDPQLAVDGIDEVLGFFDAEPPDAEPLDVPTGTVAIAAGPGRWLVEVSPTGVRSHADPDAGSARAVDARLSGEPERVLWWAWRGQTDGLHLDGRRDLVEGLRAHLAANAG